MNKSFEASLKYLQTKKKILFLTTSNRREGAHEMPKSTQLAHYMAGLIGNDKVTVHDISRMNIYPCEGNVSWREGNSCGLAASKLNDQEKNPTGFHRCRASINHPDDELRKVSKSLFESDCVVFFTSVRWWQTNMMYQKLIERLTWIENRHSTFGEENIIKDIDAGIIAIGHNWKNEEVINNQKEVMEQFGFKVPKQLSRWWIFTDMNDESNASYQKAGEQFEKDFWFELQK